jgi:hypothetical protein
MQVTKDTMVEDIYQVPGAMQYCLENRVSLFSCAGAYPQSIGSLLAKKNVQDPDAFIEGLNQCLAEQKKDGAE